MKHVEVKQPPLPRKIIVAGQPSFHHEEINSLYDQPLAMPASVISGILALPQETLVADRIHVLDDCLGRTPNFMSYDIEQFIAGDIESITHDLSTPLPPAPKTLSIIQQYQNYQQPRSSPTGSGFLEADDDDDFDSDDEPAPVAVGRNDPCPCGSGKKYKKCCLR